MISDSAKVHSTQLYYKGECARAGAKTHCLPVQLSHSRICTREAPLFQFHNTGRFGRVFVDNLRLLAGSILWETKNIIPVRNYCSSAAWSAIWLSKTKAKTFDVSPSLHKTRARLRYMMKDSIFSFKRTYKGRFKSYFKKNHFFPYFLLYKRVCLHAYSARPQKPFAAK